MKAWPYFCAPGMMSLSHILVSLLILGGLLRSASASPADQCRFIGFHDLGSFTQMASGNGVVMLSPIIKAPMAWNELVASWNVAPTTNAVLTIEASGIYPDHQSRFYTLGIWSSDRQLRRAQASMYCKSDARPAPTP